MPPAPTGGGAGAARERRSLPASRKLARTAAAAPQRFVPRPSPGPGGAGGPRRRLHTPPTLPLLLLSALPLAAPAAASCTLTISRKPGAPEAPLELSEVQVFDGSGSLVTPARLSYWLSSEADGFPVGRCFDGITAPGPGGAPGCASLSGAADPEPRMVVRIPCAGGRVAGAVSRVEVSNRGGCCPGRAGSFRAELADAGGKVARTFAFSGAKAKYTFSLDGARAAGPL